MPPKRNRHRDCPVTRVVPLALPSPDHHSWPHQLPAGTSSPVSPQLQLRQPSFFDRHSLDLLCNQITNHRLLLIRVTTRAPSLPKPPPSPEITTTTHYYSSERPVSDHHCSGFTFHHRSVTITAILVEAVIQPPGPLIASTNTIFAVPRLPPPTITIIIIHHHDHPNQDTTNLLPPPLTARPPPSQNIFTVAATTTLHRRFLCPATSTSTSTSILASPSQIGYLRPDPADPRLLGLDPLPNEFLELSSGAMRDLVSDERQLLQHLHDGVSAFENHVSATAASFLVSHATEPRAQYDLVGGPKAR